MSTERLMPQWESIFPKEVLPETIQYRFSRLLGFFAISYEGFRTFTDEQMEQPLFPPSDTPIIQLRHITLHTAAMVYLMQTATDEQPGILKSYDYVQEYPKLAAIENLNKEQLLYQLQISIGEIFLFLQKYGVLNRKVQKPWKPLITISDAVGDLSEHFSLHAQNVIDYYEKHEIPRSQTMKKALG